MIPIVWNGATFSMMDLGRGRFLNDMTGHSHSKHSYELHYIIDGEGTLVTVDHTYSLSRGDFFVTGPNVYHQQTTSREHPLEEIYIYLQLDREKSKNSLVDAFVHTPFFFQRLPELEPLMQALLDEYLQKELDYTSATSARMQLLLTYIIRAYRVNVSSREESVEDLNDRRLVLIEREFIYNRERVTLSSLAQTIGVSERQMQRLMQQYYGKSFTQMKAEAVRNGEK